MYIYIYTRRVDFMLCQLRVSTQERFAATYTFTFTVARMDRMDGMGGADRTAAMVRMDTSKRLRKNGYVTEAIGIA